VTRPPARRFPTRPILALAAVLILSGTILATFLVENISRTASFEAYQKANLAMLSAPSGPRLDMVTNDFSRTQQYLASLKAPRVPDLPGALLDLPTAGCKALYWNNQMLSLTCFRLPDGELLHVFVIDKEAFHSVNVGADFKEMDGWHVKFERFDGMLVMLVSRAPMDEIKKYI
jgi:hypothetical protein